MQMRTEIFAGFAMLSLAVIGHGALALWAEAGPGHRGDHARCALPQTYVVPRIERLAAGPASPPRLWLDLSAAVPGEEVRVSFALAAPLPSDAWIGVVPSGVPHGSEMENDQHDLSYRYLEGREHGTLVFQAPDQPGAYDLRLHDTDRNGRELASVSFQVVGAGHPDGASARQY